MELNSRIVIFELCLLVVTLCAYGFVFGFGAFLALTAGFALLCWASWRCVLCRPRVAPQGVFVGSYFGEQFYMEVV